MKRKAKFVVIMLIITGFTVLFAAACQKQNSGGGTGNTLTYWLPLNPNVGANFTNLGDTPFAKELAAKTNTVVEYLHPAGGTENEQFNLIVASGDYPDMMERNWLAYPGGPEKAIDDGVLLKLNDTLESFSPNLRGYLRSNPDIDKSIKTDNGSYYTYPFIRGDTYLLNSFGGIIRKDWLDELGLSVPATIDEWHTVLTAFKQRKGIDTPLTLEGGYLMSNEGIFAYAYKLTPGFFLGDDGSVRYGVIEPAFRDYLSAMAQWYREGLFDPDIASINGTQVTTKMTTGAAGASVGWLASGMGIWITTGRSADPSFNLTGTPYPVLSAGDQRTVGRTDFPYANNGTGITTACKNLEAAARYLDYGYSQEGHLLHNFGIEGQSYTMVNGYPTYTPLITNNPEGLSIGHMIAAYARSVYSGSFVQDRRYLEQYLQYPEQVETAQLWMPNDAVLSHKLPPLTPSPTESDEFASIMNEINTYADEMSWRFIQGLENFNNYDAFIGTVRQMGIDRAIAIYNAALARFNRR